jgi:hypothetical protein
MPRQSALFRATQQTAIAMLQREISISEALQISSEAKATAEEAVILWEYGHAKLTKTAGTAREFLSRRSLQLKG